MKERDLEGPTDLGVTSRDVRISVCHFMKSFWVKFGRMEARSMAEARQAKVGFFFIAYCFSPKFSITCLLFL